MDFNKMQEEARKKMDNASYDVEMLLKSENIAIQNTSWLGLNIFIINLSNPNDKPKAISIIDTIKDDLAYGATIMPIKDNNSRIGITF